MASKRRKNAVSDLSALRASGAVAATFHPDGSLASVAFPAVVPEVAAAKPEAVKAQQSSDDPPPRHIRTDLDALTDLPSFEDDADAN